MARLRARIRPAQVLERLGAHGAAELLRRLAWGAHAFAPTLRPRHAVKLVRLWTGERSGRRAYVTIGEADLIARRRSDTVFVFGSGRSLVDISDDDWQAIGECDTVGFSHFHRQRWVRVDYHLIAEVASTHETAASIRQNARYRNTAFGLMRGWLAEASNEMLAERLLPSGSEIFRWRRVARGRDIDPTTRLDDGLVHGVGTIQDVVNFALVLGWRRVVIAGVDLYNKEYFWLPPLTTHAYEAAGVRADDRWGQANVLAETFGRWRDVAAARGIELFVYDERSLLARTLPVFRW